MDIQNIRQLLSEGETGQAITALIALLEKDGRYKDTLLRTLRVTEANFNAVRQQELKGILSFQEAQREYSRVNDVVLALLDDVEAGRVPGTVTGAPGRNRLWLPAGAVLLVLVAVFGVWKLRGRLDSCPDFQKKAGLHVLILPFDNIGGPKALPGLVIRDSIQNLTRKANIPAEVKTYKKQNDNEAFSERAEEILGNCDVDLVIYGQYKAFSGDSIRVRMGFRFKSGASTISGAFKTYRDITDVQPTRDLEDAVFSLCAMLAIRNDKLPFAKRWMAKIQEKDQADQDMENWLAKQGGG